MEKRSTRRTARRWIGPLALLALAACGSDGSAIPNADATTIAPVVTTEEDEPMSTDTDAQPGADDDEPSDTLRPPEEPASTTTVASPRTTDASAPTTSTGADEPPVELSATQRAMADVAIADVTERRSVDPSDVVVVAVEEVTWPDGSLGCPQRDMQYQQVLTPGVRVIVEADGQRAFYHGTSASDLSYCAAPQAPIDA